ncbi:MAG: ubiquinone/menaquinone biosynthesis methyltransferase [Verrucomicrobiales bacterium]
MNNQEFDQHNIVKGFDRIARRYDQGNDAMTLGLHRKWRQGLCREALRELKKDSRVLDLATGTCDVILELLRRRPDLSITGLDPSEGMLEVGAQKLQQRDVHADLVVGDARTLPFASESFDVVTMAWGIRNVVPYQEGLAEIFRVLRPGGRCYLLESGTPENVWVNGFYQQYSRLLPLIGGKVTGYKRAYEYYQESVNRFPSGQDFLEKLALAKFCEATYRGYFGGIVYLYQARRGAS